MAELKKSGHSGTAFEEREYGLMKVAAMNQRWRIITERTIGESWRVFIDIKSLEHEMI